MAGSGQTSIKFNDAFFDQILNSAGVRALTRGAAEKALGVAKANAPVDTGAYRDGLQVEAVQRAHRTTFMVVGHDPKTMLVEIEDRQSPQGVEGGEDMTLILPPDMEAFLVITCALISPMWMVCRWAARSLPTIRARIRSSPSGTMAATRTGSAISTVRSA